MKYAIKIARGNSDCVPIDAFDDLEAVLTDFKRGIIYVNTEWDIFKISERFQIENVNGEPYQPIFEKCDLSNTTRKEELDKLYRNEFSVGAILKMDTVGFGANSVLLRNTDNKHFYIVGADLICSPNTITLEGVNLTPEDVIFQRLVSYSKVIVRDNLCLIPDWLPERATVIGRVVNLDKIKSLIEMATKFDS